jgi:2-methylisocitrate lyase-like PEP mutase family enzyme
MKATKSVLNESALILPAVWDAASARAAHSAGARALFLSGSALAGSLGFPDIGLVPLEDLVRTTSKIRDATALPLIVDAEYGFGGLPQLKRAARALESAGATGLLIEDQEFTGQSVAASSPGLCDACDMVARIRVAKEAGVGGLAVLARTDIVGGDWPFDETLGRLEQYRDAGADWLTAVYVRSREELAAAAHVGKDQFVGIAVPGATGYIPDPADAFSLGCVGLIVTGFLQAAFRELRELYAVALEGDTPALRARQPSRQEFEAAMGFERFSR